jgi:predicted O-methyltransferase YrrM
MRILRSGGVLLTDNVLQEGDIIESKFLIERRDRTIHKRMREFLYEIKHNNFLESSIIPIGDGVALSILKGKE